MANTYTLEKSLDGMSGWSTAASGFNIVTPVMFMAVTNLAPNTTYYFRAYSTDGVNNSPYSNIVSATTLDGPATSQGSGGSGNKLMAQGIM